MEPKTVPTASDMSACLARGSLPSLSSRPPLLATPMSVPAVSNKSTNRNANTITKKSMKWLATNSKLNWQK